MIWLPDTNFRIEILKRPDGPAAERFRRCQSGDLRTSVIVRAELLHGARKYGLPEKRRQPFDVILCVPDESLERYLGGAGIARTGRMIGLESPIRDFTAWIIVSANRVAQDAANSKFRNLGNR